MAQILKNKRQIGENSSFLKGVFEIAIRIGFVLSKNRSIYN